jgi:nitrate reductase molybdenum cofactor assembly chaperone NarJ/NarW
VAGSMIEEHRSLFKIVSLLLGYPQEDLLSSISEIRAAAVAIPVCSAKSACTDLMGYLESQPLLSLQEEYTRTFDLNPSTSLNLTFHQLGESRKRGHALAELIQVYRNAGYETSTDELPDYLPMVLEFLSICPSEAGKRVLVTFEDSLRKMADRLRGMKSPYAGLMDALLALSGGCTITGA